MRASRAARPRTRAQRLIHDLLDGASATAALCTAPKTSINLPRRAWRQLRNAHRAAHVVVAQDVAGTNDHGRGRLAGRDGHWIFKTATGCKRKNGVFKRFQTMRLRPAEIEILPACIIGVGLFRQLGPTITHGAPHIAASRTGAFIEHSSKVWNFRPGRRAVPSGFATKR